MRGRKDGRVEMVAVVRSKGTAESFIGVRNTLLHW
jgi:hypothetical protein